MQFNVPFNLSKWILTAIWVHLCWFGGLVDAGQVIVDDSDGAISYTGPWQQGNGCSS
jgi:hypothetical protein